MAQPRSFLNNIHAPRTPYFPGPIALVEVQNRNLGIYFRLYFNHPSKW